MQASPGAGVHADEPAQLRPCRSGVRRLGTERCLARDDVVSVEQKRVAQGRRNPHGSDAGETRGAADVQVQPASEVRRDRDLTGWLRIAPGDVLHEAARHRLVKIEQNPLYAATLVAGDEGAAA